MSSESFMEYTPMLDTQFGEITPCLSILHCSLFLFHTFLGLSCHHEHVVSIHHILPGSWTAETLIAPFLASIHHLSLSENISVGIMMLDQWIYGYDMVFCFRKNPFQWIRRFCFSNHFFGSKKKRAPNPCFADAGSYRLYQDDFSPLT